MAVEILVVDDEPDLALLIRQKFRKRIRSGEWEFHFAQNGFEALDVLKLKPEISLVLTDINMPGMDGLTLLDRLAQLDRFLKAVVVSAYGDMSNIRTVMNRGAFDFITKSVDFDDLEITVEKTLREVNTYRKALESQLQLVALQKELAVARRIQEAFIPDSTLERPGVSINAYLAPAQEVGGDFYDFFELDDRHIGFVIGDVAGKGVSAALFMAITRTLVRAIALNGVAPEACLTYVNTLLFPQSLAEVFVTAVYGILDVQTGDFTYTTAGHFPPSLITSAGEVTSLKRTGGLGLCMTGQFDYQSETVRLNPGDGLFIYTDGVTEASRRDGTQFGEDALQNALEQTRNMSTAERVASVVSTIVAFTGDAPQSDDLTILALSYPGYSVA
jgi:sigma-B regulation protein RsbU (phosphoserine phosphatase)